MINNNIVFNSPMKYYSEFMMIKNVNDLTIAQTTNHNYIQYFTEAKNIKDFYIKSFKEGMDILNGVIGIRESRELIMKTKIDSK